MKESISLEAYITLTSWVLPRTSPNEQGLLLTISSVTAIETLQHSPKFLNSVKENGYDLEHLVSHQVLLGRNVILKSVNKTELISQQLPNER